MTSELRQHQHPRLISIRASASQVFTEVGKAFAQLELVCKTYYHVMVYIHHTQSDARGVDVCQVTGCAYELCNSKQVPDSMCQTCTQRHH